MEWRPVTSRGDDVAFDGSDLSFSRRALLKAGSAFAFGAALAEPSMAAADAAEARGFDFLHGRWNVVHRKLRERLVGNTEWFEFPGTLEVAPILGGLGNFDQNVLSDPKGTYEASSLRLFNPREKQWSIWWFDARLPSLDPPVVGGFQGKKGTFYSRDVFKDRPIRVRTTYEPLSPDHAQWTQAFSPDDGATWEVNWIMDFKRAST
jgi:hypothetical protein